MNLTTINGTQVRNFKRELNSDCNCSPSSSYYIGEVLVDGQWHWTKWNLDGSNVSGVERWRINISNAPDSSPGNI